MVKKVIEKKLFLSLAKLHYIFLSSSNVVNYFTNKFVEFGHNLKKIPLLVDTGYLKLDNVIKELKKIKNVKSHILVAPTFSGILKNYNMSDKLHIIIESILLKGEKVIFRPHPLDLTNKGNINKVEKILNRFKKNVNFLYDNSSSYIDSYSKAKLLITDFSGTAYTFAYSTLRPVIFFSKNEVIFKKNKVSSLFYFKDRNTVGLISKNINELLSSIKKINQKKTYNKNKILFINKNFLKNLKYKINFYKKKIINQCTNLNKPVLFYCANQLTKIYLEICKKNKIEIKNIIDGNKFFLSKYLGNVRIINYEALKKKANYKIIINHLEKSVRKNIKNKIKFKKKILSVEDSKLL